MIYVLALAAIAALVVAVVVRKARSQSVGKGARDRAGAMARFPRDRPSLAEPLRAAAQATGKPRGLRWVSCDLGDEVRFAVDRLTGRLHALCSVTISFEAIPGGGMEEVEAVGNLRSATAVFTFSDGAWRTDGRIVFNLDPTQAVERFRDAVVLIEPSSAGDDGISQRS